MVDRTPVRYPGGVRGRDRRSWRRVRVRPLRPPARGLRLLPAVRRLAPACPRRAGRRAGDGHPRADRPRRHLRRGAVRQGLPVRGDPPGARRGPGLPPARDVVSGGASRAASRRTPARGGAFRDLPTEQGGLPRVTLLAHAGGPGGGRAGWAAMCRLVSATHLAGERGEPGARPRRWCDPDGIAARSAPVTSWCCSGRAPSWARPRPGAATTWPGPRWALAGAGRPPANLLVELVSHRLPGTRATGGRAPPRTPPGWPGSPAAAGLGTVLTNAVRYADRLDAPTVDVLDAARRLVALDRRHLDRGNAEGFLKSGKQMHEVAEEICRLAGLAHDTALDAAALLAHTRAVADRCALDPRADLGLGEVHFPEFEVVGRTRHVAHRRPRQRRRRRAPGPLRGGRSAGATGRPRGSGSGSGSTTSCGSSRASATRRTSSPSPTSPT